MDSELNKAVEEIKNLTCKLINKLQQDDYDALEELIDKRQESLNNLEKMNYTKEQYCAAVEEFEIIHFQQELSKIMDEKRHKLKKEIDNISKRRIVTKSYNNHACANIFSKKI